MAAARAIARTGTAIKRTADKGDTWSDSEDFATGDRRFRALVPSSQRLRERHEVSSRKRKKFDNSTEGFRDKRDATPGSQDRPRLPTTGLLDYFRELAGRRNGTSESSGDEHTSVINAWLEGADKWPAQLESAARTVLRQLGGVEEGARRGQTLCGPLGTQKVQPRLIRSSSTRLKSYARCQRLLRTDPARLASEILDGKESFTCPISLETIFWSFKKRWGAARRVDGLGRSNALERLETLCNVVSPRAQCKDNEPTSRQ